MIKELEVDPYLVEMAGFEKELRKTDPFMSKRDAQMLATNRVGIRFYVRLRERLIGLAAGKTYTYDKIIYSPEDLWRKYVDGQYDGGQALSVFRSLLISHGMLEGDALKEAMEMKMYFVDPEEKERQMKAAKDRQTLIDAFDEILRRVKDKQNALAIYNSQGDRPRSKEKLENWVRELVAAGELGIEYVPGARAGNFLAKLLEPLRQVKMIDPRTENKNK